MAVEDCVGSELNVDEFGRVGFDLCGDPADTDWPHPCPPSISNGLYRDASGCIWSAPLVKGLQGWARQSPDCLSLCEFSTSVAFSNLNVVSLTITNPDPCRPIDVFVTTFYRWQFAASATPFLGQFWRRVTGVDNADPGWILVYSDEQPDTQSTEWGTTDAWSITGLASGAMATITVGQRANTSTGEAVVSNTEAAIGAIALSTDV